MKKVPAVGTLHLCIKKKKKKRKKFLLLKHPSCYVPEKALEVKAHLILVVLCKQGWLEPETGASGVFLKHASDLFIRSKDRHHKRYQTNADCMTRLF